MDEIATRAQICAEILRHENELIKASYVISSLGIPKNNVYYHFKKLVADGILEKAGTRYAVVDRDKLITAMLAATEGQSNLKRCEPTPLFPKRDYSDSLQKIVNNVIWGRAMDLPESLAVKVFIGEKIDEVIRTLKKEKHYLMEKQTSRGVVRKAIRKTGSDYEWYEEACNTFESLGFNFQTPLKKRRDDLIDKMNEED